MRTLRTFEADYLATGHHARIERSAESGCCLLKKGEDKDKDQSYFLYILNREQLSRLLMPIGHLTKREVRKRAKTFGLPVAQRPESQEVCFVPDRDYARFLRARIPAAFRPGPIIDVKNRVIGEHKGIAHFTIGQRKGMGIAAPRPLYVLEIRAGDNTIVVGTNGQLYEKKLLTSRLNWISIKRLEKPMILKAKIRYKHEEARALLSPLDSGQVDVEFDKPQRAVTPGQSVVFYDQDTVVGGGIIDKTHL